MAHYKRGKCRYQGRTRVNSETFYRKRVGLVPVKITKEHLSLSRSEWRKLWLPPHGNSGTRISGPFSMMNGEPRWHDIIHHSRPRRAQEKRIARGIVTGRLLAEEALWPLSRRPHIYYH